MAFEAEHHSKEHPRERNPFTSTEVPHQLKYSRSITDRFSCSLLRFWVSLEAVFLVVCSKSVPTFTGERNG